MIFFRGLVENEKRKKLVVSLAGRSGRRWQRRVENAGDGGEVKRREREKERMRRGEERSENEREILGFWI